MELVPQLAPWLLGMKGEARIEAETGGAQDIALELATIRRSAIPAPLVRLFDGFGRAKLRWALLRPWQGLLGEEGDIDILIGHSGLGTARRILAELGFLAMPKDGPDVHAATLDRETGRFLWVHVQPELKVAGIAIPARHVPSAVYGGPYPELAGDWMLLTLLGRCLDRGEVPARYRVRLRDLALHWRGGPPQLADMLRAKGFEPARLVAAAAAADWPHLFGQIPLEGDAVANRASMATFLRRGWRFLRGSFAPQRQGLCIAIIGPDGAGKSTLIAGLEQTLPLPTRTIYMGLTGGNMRHALALRVPGLVFAAQVAVLWARFGRALFHATVGRIVLFDRYVLDGAVPPGRPMSMPRRIARRVHRWMVPLPDLVLLLDASGRTMHRRKGEYTPEILEEVRSCYRKVESRVANLAVIDAEQPADEVLRIAQGLVWQRLRQRRQC